jgi:hypothetical protein
MGMVLTGAGGSNETDWLEPDSSGWLRYEPILLGPRVEVTRLASHVIERGVDKPCTMPNLPSVRYDNEG